MIARKCGITNPEDYGLYLLVDGYGKEQACFLECASTQCLVSFRNVPDFQRVPRVGQGAFEDLEQSSLIRV